MVVTTNNGKKHSSPPPRKALRAPDGPLRALPARHPQPRFLRTGSRRTTAQQGLPFPFVPPERGAGSRAYSAAFPEPSYHTFLLTLSNQTAPRKGHPHHKKDALHPTPSRPILRSILSEAHDLSGEKNDLSGKTRRHVTHTLAPARPKRKRDSTTRVKINNKDKCRYRNEKFCNVDNPFKIS